MRQWFYASLHKWFDNVETKQSCYKEKNRYEQGSGFTFLLVGGVLNICDGIAFVFKRLCQMIPKDISIHQDM